jgi:hypothetical protein
VAWAARYRKLTCRWLPRWWPKESPVKEPPIDVGKLSDVDRRGVKMRVGYAAGPFSQTTPKTNEILDGDFRRHLLDLAWDYDAQATALERSQNTGSSWVCLAAIRRATG